MYRNNYKLIIYSAFSVITSEFPGFSAPRCNTAWRRVEQWHGSISGAELRPEMTSHFSAQTVPCAGMARRRPVRSSLIRASRDAGPATRDGGGGTAAGRAGDGAWTTAPTHNYITCCRTRAAAKPEVVAAGCKPASHRALTLFVNGKYRTTAIVNTGQLSLASLRGR